MKNIYGLILCSLMLLMSACEKDTLATNFAPGVTTGSSTDIYRKGAVLSGSMRQVGTAAIKSYGILFSELESMAEYTEYPITDKSTDFSVPVSNLTPGTTYYYCAYAHSGYNMAKGEVKSFTTPKSNAPIFEEISLTEKDEFGCKLSVSLFDDGGSKITLSGFCWTKQGEGEPTTESHIQNATIANNALSASITGWEPNSEYQVRAYAVNSDGVGYSNTIIVKTNEATAPVLSAISEKESTNFSVTVEATVTDAGTSAISKAGFCWSIDKTPTIEDNSNDITAQLKGDSLVFSATLDNLMPNSTYHIRAYATNEQGTSYSEVFTFTTAEAKTPTLSAITEKGSSDFAVTVEAEVKDMGTSEISKVGFCWSASKETPTVNDSINDMTSQLVDGNTIFSSSLTGFAPSTTYYIRAYATNEQGTSYSETFTFKTAEAKAPTLSVVTEKESSDFAVTVEATVTDAGTTAISKAGFCWSATKEVPTVDDSVNDLTSQLTSENATLSAALTDLTPNTTYYIRAYATNEQGTSYSEVFTFTTTEAKAPTFSAITEKESSDFAVTVEATVTDAGTTAISKAGFCWSATKEVPTVDDSVNDLTSQLTSENATLSAALTDLTPSTTYYIRAYATNEQGTSYSEVFTFKTGYKNADNGNTGVNPLPTTKWE